MRADEMKLRYLERRDGTLRYRRAVPKPLRKLVGKTAWIHCFAPGTPVARAVAHADQMAAQHAAIIAAARRGEAIPDAAVIADAERAARSFTDGERFDILALFSNHLADAPETPFVNALRNNGTYVPEKLTLEAAYKRDVAAYGGKRGERSISRAVEAFAPHAHGKDIRQITRGEAQAFVAKMRKDGLAESSVRRTVGPLRALLNRAYLDLEVERTNPFSKLGIKGRGSVSDRLPFHTSHLAKVDAYLKAADVQPRTRNIIRISKGTGCALSEIGGLVLSDLSLNSPIPFLVIRENAQRGVKVEVRERRVPLIGEALEAAKDAHKRALASGKGKALDKIPLFDGFSAKHGANAMSAFLNAALRRAGIPKSKRLSMYSFRHTVKEALRAAEVPDHMQRRLLGHSGHGVADDYGAPAAQLKRAHKALSKALTLLGQVDESIYRPGEMVR